MPDQIDPFDPRAADADAVGALDRPRRAPASAACGRLGRGSTGSAPAGSSPRSLTVVAVVVGGWWLLRSPAPPTEAGLPFAATSHGAVVRRDRRPVAAGAVATGAVDRAGDVVVHVAGAVAAPGVYELPAGARVARRRRRRRRARPDADVGALNLAAPLADGERVYVPVVGEDVPPTAAGRRRAAAPSAPPGPVDLNRATAAELDALPGHRSGDGPGDRRPPRRERPVRLGRRPRSGPRHRAGQARRDPAAGDGVSAGRGSRRARRRRRAGRRRGRRRRRARCRRPARRTCARSRPTSAIGLRVVRAGGDGADDQPQHARSAATPIGYTESTRRTARRRRAGPARRTRRSIRPT